MNDTQYSDGFVYGDPRADAPELAPRGSYGVGVRTLRVVSPDQLDILKYSANNPDPRYDRPLTLEVWYPAIIPPGERELTSYSDVMGRGPNDPQRPNIPFEFSGRALREAEPDSTDGPYPLIIVSHGYPGSRVLLTYLTENLASKGYVVAAIDHTDSTHGDAADFCSTLLNRSLDQLFVLDQMAEMGRDASQSFVSGLVDADRTAVIGYSMGGYGALNVGGVGYSPAGVELLWGVPGGKLAVRQWGNPEHIQSMDPRIRAIVAMAPWGWPDFFDAEGLKGLNIPSMFIVGSMDRTSGYENVRKLFEGAINSDRCMLVYQNGAHEVAVNPAPPIAAENYLDYSHYQEPAWDNMRCNNVNQHFVTAFLGIHLKSEDYREYLDLVPIANESVWSQNDDGSFAAEHTHWKGFPQWTAIGLELHHRSPGEL